MNRFDVYPLSTLRDTFPESLVTELMKRKHDAARGIVYLDNNIELRFIESSTAPNWRLYHENRSAYSYDGILVGMSTYYLHSNSLEKISNQNSLNIAWSALLENQIQETEKRTQEMRNRFTAFLCLVVLVTMSIALFLLFSIPH